MFYLQYFQCWKKNLKYIIIDPQKYTEGWTVHNNGWNGLNGMIPNTWKPCIWGTFIPFQPLLCTRPPQLRCHRPSVTYIFCPISLSQFIYAWTHLYFCLFMCLYACWPIYLSIGPSFCCEAGWRGLPAQHQPWRPESELQIHRRRTSTAGEWIEPRASSEPWSLLC